MNRELTREQIEEIETLYLERGDCLDASSYDVPGMAKLAKEALELREALERMWRGGDVERLEFRMPSNGHGYRIAIRGVYAPDWRDGEGSTPLEAIQNARRGL